MDVSVIIPTRNRSGLLQTALRAVLAQREVSLEVVVVDDASTDDTAEVVHGQDDARLRMVRQATPQGVSAARNRGAAEARGAWLAFLDDDDLWAPDKLIEQLRAARASDAAWAYVGHVNINADGRVTGGAPPLPPDALIAELPRHNVVPGGCSGVAMRRAAFVQAGPFDTALQPLADWDLWLRLSGVGRPACVARPLVAYRLHGAQMSLQAARMEADFAIVAQRNPAADAVILRRYLAWWAMRVKDHRAALRLFAGAWRRSPAALPRAVADLLVVGRDALEHRLGVTLPSAPAPPPTEAVRAWRAEGQAWVDALLGPGPPPHSGCGSAGAGGAP